MELEILELTDTKACFVISGVPSSVVNAIRRTLLSDVPKMAIETVEFHLGSIRDEIGKEYESVTPLFDEIIAHRLGLVPVPTDLSVFGFKEDCVCGGEGCPNCTVMYSLNKRGPSEEDEEDSTTVYSNELQLVGQKVDGISENRYMERFKINHKVPIVKLNRSQALLLYATAKLGTGGDHIKWQAAQAVGIQNYPVVTIDNDRCDRGGSCIRECPKKVLAEKDNEVVVTDLANCSLCKTCEEVCSLGVIKVSMENSRFIFRFETDGALTAKEAFEKAMEILSGEFEELRSTVAKLK
jgi:DNA-directed RNA polymerase subunit D